MSKRFLTAVLITFVVLSIVLFGLEHAAPDFDLSALEIGNAIMALLSVVAYLLVKRQMEGRPEAFVRGVSSASFLKLMVCMISILVYVLLNRSHIHKPSVFVLFGIYAVYTILETWLLSKIARD